ncbi:prophage endopeptidase tail family protein [Schleiferilactobacillus shenzhenensis]|uniref:prophage endopeptidase tail family protein n=1 Tax=Schleiferilactobacillus shenzhenensis TaxID=1231337 RepID=UPI0009DD0647|nr:prophage endopeptidase tail family protein [Schleiferilactobacillus shenzhenensis]
MAKASHTIFVRDANDQSEEWLTAADMDSISVAWHLNEDFSVSLTAYDRPDTHVSFEMLTNENIIVVDGQQFVIKQCSPKLDNGMITKDVTATHVYFNAQYWRVYTKNDGALTYSIQSMMDYVWSNNPLGFTYEVQGSFSNQIITDWGNCSGLDALQKAIDSFGAVVIPDNKHLILYDQNSYKRQTAKQFIWTYNTSQIDLSVDSSAIQNEAMCYGATKDDSHMQPSASGASTDSSGSTTSTPVTGLDAIGTIQYAVPGGKGVPVYDKPGGTPTGQVLENGSRWKVGASVDYNGTTWYQVGGWIDGSYITFSKDGDVEPNDPVTKVVYGIGTIKLDQGKTATTYTEPGGNVAVKDLPNGTQWQILASREIHGVTWYNVGRGEWIDGSVFDFSGNKDVEPQEPKDTSNVGDETTNTKVEYYFDPFLYRDNDSIAKWGERPGPDLTNDQIQHQDTMEAYAANTLQSDPVTTLTITYDTTDDVGKGDVWYLNAKPLGLQTMITVNGIERNPFRNTAPVLTLDNAKQTMKNINAALVADIKHAKRYSDLINATIKHKLMSQTQTGSDESGS